MINIKDHPFPVETYFDYSLVLSYAIPKSYLEDLIPPSLKLDLYNDEYAFVTVAMVQVKALRPKGFPKFLGSDFFLVGFRIFVQYMTNQGKRYRGLYIIESATTSKKMQFLGGVFTHYNYRHLDIHVERETNAWSFKNNDGLDILINPKLTEVTLPKGSPFKNWKEARRFAGPLPFTFTHKANDEVVIVEGVRSHWKPRPVEVIKAEINFPDLVNFEELKLANAFLVEQVPYYWKKGKVEQWMV